MKKFSTICRLMCVMLCACCLIIPASAEDTEDLSVTKGCHSTDAALSVLGAGEMITNVKTAVLYEPQTDTMLYSWNPDEQIYPASFVKIMTGLLVVENTQASEVVTVRQDVLDTVDVEPDLIADEVITVENLLYMMLVEGSNDASAVLADFAMGSQSSFVAEMNRYAAELGCTATNFTNPHGLHDDTQISTTRDVLKILKKASENEEFLKYFCTPHYTIPATNKSEDRNLVTGNYLMSQEIIEIHFDTRVQGGRTGADVNGFRSVATVSEFNGIRLLSIVTGAQSIYDESGRAIRSFGGFPETSRLLDLGFNGYAPIQLLFKDQTMRQCEVNGGESDVVLGAAEDIYTVLPSPVDMSQIRFEYSNSFTNLKAPIEKGAIVGTLTLWNGDMCIGSSDLYAMNGVDTIIVKLDNRDDDGLGVAGTVILIVAIIIVFVFAVLLCVRWFGVIRNNRRKRRYRRNHRRSR